MFHATIEQNPTVSFEIGFKILIFQRITIQHYDLMLFSENGCELVHNATLYTYERVFGFLTNQSHLFFG